MKGKRLNKLICISDEEGERETHRREVKQRREEAQRLAEETELLSSLLLWKRSLIDGLTWDGGEISHSSEEQLKKRPEPEASRRLFHG